MEVGIQWPLVLFTLIAGAGYGLLATTGLARLAGKQGDETRTWALIATLVLLVVGGLMSVFHLVHPERFMGAIANLFSFSGIALELISLGIGVVVAGAFLLLGRAGNAAGEKVCAVLAIVVGVAAAFLQGYAYFEVAAQPGWHSLALALGYLFTSLTAGSLAYVVVAVAKRDDEATVSLVVKVAMGLAACAAVAAVAYAATLSGEGLLDGTAMTIAVVAVACELIALGAGAWMAFKAPSATVAAGGVLAGVGGSVAVRVLMWVVAAYGFDFLWMATANRGLLLF